MALTLPILPHCDHRGAVLATQCFCRLHGRPGVAVDHARCSGCPHSSAWPIDQPPACPYRGDPIGSIVSTCRTTNRHHVYGCTLHGACVLTGDQAADVAAGQGSPRVRCCATCTDRPTTPAITRVITPPDRGARPIRVGLLSPCLATGGVERWLVTLARHTRRVHWTGVALHSREHSAVHARMLAEVEPLMPVHYDRRRILDDSDIVLTWAEDRRPELLEWRGGKLVHVIHGESSWSRSCAAANAERLDHVIAVSDSAAAVAPPGVPLTTIANAVDPERLIPSATRSELREDYGIRDRLAIVYLGRWSAEKQPMAAAYAAAELGAVAVYCSTGSDDGIAWRHHVRAVCPDAVFVDPGRPGDALTVADCLIHPSLVDAFGIVFLEAWYAGIPVVSHNIGVVPAAERLAGEQLTERISDHTSLGAAVAAAITNGDRIAAGRRVVCEHFLPATQAARYESLFRSILSID